MRLIEEKEQPEWS